jgi:hypothetical protein
VQPHPNNANRNSLPQPPRPLWCRPLRQPKLGDRLRNNRRRPLSKGFLNTIRLIRIH